MRNLLLRVALAVFATSTATPDLFAGHFKFREQNHGKGDRVGAIADNECRAINFKKHSMFVNDEARSVRLSWVRPGTRLFVYDNPDGKRNDDWAEILVKSSDRDIVIDSFEQTRETAFYKITYHRKNGLDGKVSHIKVFPPMRGAQPATAKDRVFDALSRSFRQWNDKRGEAYQYQSGGSNYRIWLPEVSGRGNTVQVSLALEHIRGGGLGDDPGTVAFTLTKGRNGKWSIKTADAVVKFNNDKFDWTINAGGLGGAASAADIAAQLATGLFNTINIKLTRGRLNFKNVIKHNTERAVDAAIVALNTR